MVCPDGSVNVSVQPLIALLLVFLMVMLLVRPVFHELTVSWTEQPPVGGGGVVDTGGGGVVDTGGGGVVDTGGGGVVDTGGVFVRPPKKSIAYCTMPLCGSVWPCPCTLMPSTGAWTVLL